MDFLIWPFTKDCQISKIKFSGGHNVIAAETLNCQICSFAKLSYGTSTLLIFRLTEVIAMVAQLYILVACFILAK